MDWIYGIAALNTLAAILAWVAKLRWSKEFGDAKDQTIKAKEAQIEVLKAQIDSLKSESQSLRELTPMKLREYLTSTKTMLEEYNDALKQDLQKAHEELDSARAQIGMMEQDYQRVLLDSNFQPRQAEELSKIHRSLEQASRAEAMAMLTHGMLTRLQAVIANAEILTEEITTLNTERALVRVKELLNNALALGTVIQNLETEDSSGDYHFRRQPIAILLDEAKHQYEAEARRRSIDITLHLQPVNGQLPIMEISAFHLQHALNNLVHNAVRFSWSRNPVKIIGRPAGTHCYKVTFENYGTGILPDETEAIFQDGYRGILTQSEFRVGSGKGLSAVKRVIERHGGDIAVESKPTSDAKEPREQLYLNRFTIILPYEQPKRN
jgi:signal transduction histidine kinase